MHLTRDAWARATLAAAMVGVALRLWQWATNPSLWLDELMLARNVLERRVPELLFQGLDYGQAAPVGYLFLTKVSVILFGEGEMALRLVPMAASILALVVIWRLARLLLGASGGLVTTAAFGLNPLLISLSSVVKPYATDVLAVTLILAAFLYLWEDRGPMPHQVGVGLGAGALGLLSIPSIIVAAPVLVVLLYRIWDTGHLHRTAAGFNAMVPVLVWGVTAMGAAFWASAVVNPDLDFLQDYWNRAGAFAPAFTDYPTWVLDRWKGSLLPGLLLREYIGVSGSFGSFLEAQATQILVVGTVVLCAVSLVRLRGLAWTTAILSPFLVALLLARFELYPLDVRTSVYLLPFVLLLLGALIAFATDALRHRVSWVAGPAAALFVLLHLAILVDRPPPYVVQQDREIIRELMLRKGNADPVFAHAWSRSAFWYYGSRFGMIRPPRFGNDETTLREDVAALRGFAGESSLWLLFTHSRNRAFYLCYLDEVGREVDRVVLEGAMPNSPVSLHLYDLSDETRWGRTDVDRFPSDIRTTRPNAVTCQGGQAAP